MTFCVYVHMKPNLTPFYVGKGSVRRARSLCWQYRNKWHGRVVSKHGRKNIIIEVLECQSDEEAKYREMQTIKHLRLAGVKLANLTDGGEGTLGRTLSQSERDRISERCKGVALSEIHKERMSEAHKGKKFSEEHKAKISAAHKGKVFSEETRQKLSANLKGKPLSAETRAKMSEAAKGKIISEGTRKKLSATQKCRMMLSGGQTGYKWINKSGKSKTISIAQVEEYLLAGWVLGRGSAYKRLPK